MTKFALIDAEGFPQGFYSRDINGENIPEDAVEITDLHWMELLENQGRRRWENGAVVPYEPPLPSLSASDVDIEHDRRANVGKIFTVAGYGEIPLEGSLRTQTVLLALKDTARDLLAAEVNAPVLFLTDRDNGDHNLTAEQVIELVNAGKTFMQALHEAKRALKAMDPIPADYADERYWPAV